jgi:hypothetical protein
MRAKERRARAERESRMRGEERRGERTERERAEREERRAESSPPSKIRAENHGEPARGRQRQRSARHT